MKLYTYWRSTTSYRVRAALALKGISYEAIPGNLLEGDQRAPDYAALNPIKGVPTLVTDDGAVLTQSMAILDYLEEVAPTPALLPTDPIQRARLRAAALTMATDTHPMNNLKVLNYLKEMGQTQEACIDWMRHWMGEGFAAYAALVDPDTPFSFGDTPTLAFLVDRSHADLL